MMDGDGRVRPHWARLVSALEELGPDALGARFGRADRYLRDAGVYYRMYGDETQQEREWPLAHVPVLVDGAEWARLVEGLVQRAELLEALAADIYGENALVARGLLPPALIAASSEFLRPMVGVKPADGHFLHFCAFELGRGPDGQWWVLGDRMQAPSGAGFAVENRVATTRALPETFASMNVHRLAGFFRGFRDALFGLVRNAGSRVAVLTPGSHNDTYFEHAYIARYLGVMLLEGEDLAISNGTVMVRTVSGLKPIDVLWRRLDSAFLDPLEFNSASRIGVAGMGEALRNGAVSMVNAAGTGVLETRGLLAFLPTMCRAVRGEDLLLPNIATWWCGQDAERAHVAAKLDTMMVGSAHATALAFEHGGAAMLGSRLGETERAVLLSRLATEGESFVAQEAVTLSTTPFFDGEKLEPRPVVLRAFAARTKDGWTVMPGGFARVGTSTDTTAISMQRGGRAADVWVLSPKPVEQVSLLPREGDAVHRERPGSLPSRAADNLLWLGRYVERSENLVRILRAYHGRLAETADLSLPLLAELRDHLEALGVDHSRAIPERLRRGIDSTVASAGRIRDRFSPDGRIALDDLSKTVHRFAEVVQPGDDASRAMTVLLRKIAGFSGLVHENMYRFTGWRFLEIGRRLERGIQIAWIVARLTRPDAPDGALEMLLEITDSGLTQRRRYGVNAGRSAVLDLLALDPFNPRSVVFQLAALKEQIGLLPGNSRSNIMTPVVKEILRLHTSLAILEPQTVTADVLHGYVRNLTGLADLVERTYFH